MTTDPSKQLPLDEIRRNVQCALEEDVGTGDISAVLIPSVRQSQARIIARESAVLAGRAWAEETFQQTDPAIQLDWHFKDGEAIAANESICEIQGPAQGILTAERTALNFLQTLSAVATQTAHYVQLVAETGVVILDTRKTIPGLRTAQKYAVHCGGGHNHRMGLFDAYLIKENHIRAAGGIEMAIAQARANQPDAPIEIEVENLEELSQALALGVTQILLDNFTLEMLVEAVKINQGRARLEASGGIKESTVRQIAGTGIDAISIGALTKNIQATDFSLLFEVT